MQRHPCMLEHSKLDNVAGSHVLNRPALTYGNIIMVFNGMSIEIW